MAVVKRILPTAVAIAAGLFVLIAIFVNPPPEATGLDLVGRAIDIGTYFIDTAIVIATFALFLGVINVLRVHARKIGEGQSGVAYSLVLIASMLLVLVLGLPALPGQASGPSQPIVKWIFDNIQVPIQASLSALLAFFVVTAASRLLLVRNLESSVMLVVAVLVLLGQVAYGLLPIFADLKEWILDVPTLAGVRGIVLGVALGAVLTGIRLLLGVERPYHD
jgi:hypothetical protein